MKMTVAELKEWLDDYQDDACVTITKDDGTGNVALVVWADGDYDVHLGEQEMDETK